MELSLARVLNAWHRFFAMPFIFLVDVYQAALRPMLAPACRFHPSCSDFAREAIESRGVFHGIFLTLSRIARCHPFHPGGFDPVPKNIR